MSEGAFAAVVLAAALVLARALWDARQQLRAAREALFRAAVARAEAERLHRAERQLAEAQRLAETTVAAGTGLVRTVHQGIAAIPFGILEAIPVTRDTTRLVRKTHDLISDAVYGSIGAVNRGVGARLREGLKGEGRQASPAPNGTPAEPPDDRR